MNTEWDDEPKLRLRALAAGLTKCGIPVQLRTDADHQPYLRASHPSIPLSTDVYCRITSIGSWSFHSEWSNEIAPADDLVSTIAWVIRLLRIPSDKPDGGDSRCARPQASGDTQSTTGLNGFEG